MSEVTQPRTARGKVLPIGIVAAALFALLALAPLASAASDPVASGSTTIVLNKGIVKGLGKAGIKISAIKPATVKGTKATFKVTGGKFDPTSGAGTLTHSGGLTLKAGKKSVAIKAFEVNTKSKGLFGKVGGKKVKVAAIAGVKLSRSGFGASATINKLKLTGNAAAALNKALGFKSNGPIKGNRTIGKASTKEQPKETALVPGGAMTFALNAELAKKLGDVGAKLVPLTGTTVLSPTTFSFPVTGGTFSANGTAGTVQSSGGLSLVQNLTIAGKNLDTNITLGGFWYDLAAKTITVEVSATSTASKELNLGALGRSSVSDVTIGGVIADPKTRTVSIQNSSAVLQPLSGEVLNGFTKVFAEVKKGSIELEALKLKEEAEAKGKEAETAKKEAEVAAGKGEFAKAAEKQKEAETKGKEAEEKKKAAEAKLAEAAPAAAKILATDAIAGGQPLGLISFTGQAQ